jgi:hypothetical protein
MAPLRRMGGAKRYPSMPARVAMGFAALHPSYALYWSQPQDTCPEVNPPAPSVGL